MNISAVSFGCDCKKDDKKVSNYAKGGFAAGAGIVGLPLSAAAVGAAIVGRNEVKDTFMNIDIEKFTVARDTAPKFLKPIFNFINKPFIAMHSGDVKKTEKEAAKLLRSYKARIAVVALSAIAISSAVIGGIGAGIAATTGAISKAIDKK